MTPTTGTTTTTSTAYAELIELYRQAQVIHTSGMILGWDQETVMPTRGVEYRSRQLAQLARIVHEMRIAPRIGELLGACESDGELMQDPLHPDAVNVREIRRRYDRLTRLPAALVEEEARISSLGQHVWAEARRDSSFEHFRPTLERIVDLMRRKAECYGWAADGEPWDALAEDYETGCTAAGVERVFTPLRGRLQSLLQDLMGSGRPPGDGFNRLPLPTDQQHELVRFVAEQIGFDFSRGRLDTSTHPFCSGSHCHDVRLTTRFHESNVNDALGSTMHEAGHGIYEQGLLYEHVDTPMGDSISLGIHESQSRMWENQVGRSRAFWTWLHAKLPDFFGDAVKGLSLDDTYGAANVVQPSLIRVEADEATYNMHIMIRFELERAIMAGDLDIADIPEAWNARYKDYLGIDVPDDARGCLQDIHWSMCAMGYFPTYTLGNLYCAQIFEKAQQVMPDLHEQFERGQFEPLRTWLNTNIHAHGCRYRPGELCEHVTGQPLSADPLLRHLEGKLRPLYGL
ncbi:MAG: carboxypeptidase M32 [Planctomycetota bacterium]